MTLCRFCLAPVENTKRWPVCCKACYENGTYGRWLSNTNFDPGGDVIVPGFVRKGTAKE